MNINIGPYYSDLVKNATSTEKEDTATFVSFVMAGMGDNMSESFNERQLSVGALIMTSDRTCLKPEQIQVMALLRMNVEWMESRKCAFGCIFQYLDMKVTEGLTIMS